ncbi:hypothetical protein HOLleu_15101 [Holothuria leucospilota]|uniref:C2H2-type domain-containing protein n=1 Tax=Holothuria leucospilota TaxID=206669 RepID=A0A9Q1C9L5_HOLLE|nr:hypothetical protein HOLleu_15101 [Holothuria leucospilota]
MGQLQVEVKILRKAPVLFAWENKLTHVVESYLVTCPCQQLGLQTVGNNGDASSIFTGGDKEWAAKLAQALELSEVVSFSSLDPCVSISAGIHLFEDSKEECVMSKEEDVTYGKKKRKNAKKSQREKKAKLSFEKAAQKTKLGLEKAVHEKNDVSLYCADDSNVDDKVVQGQTLTTIKPEGEEAQGESEGSMQVFSRTEDGQHCYEDSNKSFGNPTADVEVDLSNSYQQMGGSNEVDKMSRSNSEDALSSAANSNSCDNEGLGSLIGPAVTYELVPEARNEEPLNDDANKKNILSTRLPYTTPDGKVAVSKDPITITHVTSATGLGTAVTDVQALISEMSNAMSSIMDIYPVGVSDEPQNLQQAKPLDGAESEGMDQQRESKVNFVRALTEGERKKMFKFRSDTYERNRKQLNEGGKCFLCEHCGKILTLSVRKRHMDTHSKSRPRNFVCDQCGKKFHSKTNLKHHIESHSSEPSYKCRYCPKKYKTFFGRTMHERAHFNVYVGQCDKCGRKFQEVGKLRLHETFGCETRRKQTRHRPRKHQTEFTVSQDDPGTSTCNICEKVVLTKSLPSHMDTHSDKMFTCPICKKIVKYSTKYTHMNVHSDKRNFTCSVCSKSFKTKTTLTTHMRTHTGERPLKCRFCDRSFSRYSSREVHETSHTGERRFPCTICNKGWKDRPTYMAHMKKHHPGAPLFYRRKSSMMTQLASFGMAIEDHGDPGN